MFKVVDHNTLYNYKLYDVSKDLDINLSQFKYQISIAHTKYLHFFKDVNISSTWGYKLYNLFSLTAGSTQFYRIFTTIKSTILDYLQTGPDNLFMECWVNYHKQNEVLDWHDHDKNYFCHGYLSIDPKNTITEFKDYSIVNKIGQIYIGPSGKLHRVVAKDSFSDNRITIAFNVIHLENMKKITVTNLGYIPL